MSPVAEISYTAELGIRSFAWAITGPPYSNMPRNMFELVTVTRGWATLARMMK